MGQSRNPKLNKHYLQKLHQRALDNYKNISALAEQDATEFRAFCWAKAVIDTLNEMGYVDFELSTKIKDIPYEGIE